MSSRRQQPWLRLLDVVVGVVAGAAVAVLVQNVADKKRAEKKERREGDDSGSMEKMTAAILRLEDKLGRTCDHIDAWLDDAVYDATTNDTYLDAHQTSGIAAREDAGGVVAGLAPVSAAAAAAAVAQPKQDDGKLSMMAMCQDFDAGIEGPDSLQAARTLLEIGEPAAALLLHDNESRQVEPVVMSELYWRLARACYLDSLGYSTKEQQRECYLRGLKFGIEAGERCWQGHKYTAIMNGLLQRTEGTSEKISRGHKYKVHICKAIELNPGTDANCHHLYGRWCFEVAQLSWITRRAAAALFGEPPNSTIEEALDEFMKAEEVAPDFSRANQLFVGKCYKQLNDLPMARLWTKKCLALPAAVGNSATEDVETIEEANTFLADLH
eukprot:gene23612-19897_t